MNDPNVHQQFDFNQLKGPELKIKVFLELKDFYLGKAYYAVGPLRVATNFFLLERQHEASGQVRRA